MKHTYTLFYVEIIVLGVVVMLSLLLKPYVWQNPVPLNIMAVYSSTKSMKSHETSFHTLGSLRQISM